jgi:hypothetical protein
MSLNPSDYENEYNYKCVICQDYFIEPIKCKKCGGIFCNQCIKDLQEMNKGINVQFKCPNFQCVPFEYEKDEYMEERLRSLRFKCPLCKLKIEGLNEYRSHRCKKKNIENIEKELLKKEIELIKQKSKEKIEENDNEENNNSEKANSKKESSNKSSKRKFSFHDGKYSSSSDEKPKVETDETFNGYINGKQIHEFVNFLEIKTEENYSVMFDKFMKSKKTFKEFSKTQDFIKETNKKKEEYNPKNYIKFSELKIPKKCQFIEKYNLYYCFKKTDIDCTCCPDHICKPGCCFCRDCMKVNVSYHGLKIYYLINKAGRASKYSHGYFHCHCRTNQSNERFYLNLWCHEPSIPCDACQELYFNMNQYLDDEIITSLRGR